MKVKHVQACMLSKINKWYSRNFFDTILYVKPW